MQHMKHLKMFWKNEVEDKYQTKLQQGAVDMPSAALPDTSSDDLW